MNLQYISDTKGQTTGVFIPIEEWNALIKKYKEIEKDTLDIPDWQKELVLNRLGDYNNSDNGLDFDCTLDAIEKDI